MDRLPDSEYPPYAQRQPPGDAPTTAASRPFAQTDFPATPFAQQFAPIYPPYGTPQVHQYYAPSAGILPPPSPHETSTSFPLAERQHQRESGQAATGQPYAFSAPHAPVPSTPYVPPGQHYSPFPFAAIPSREDAHLAPSPPLMTRPPLPYPFVSPPVESLESLDLVAAQSFVNTSISPAPRVTHPSSASALLQPPRSDAGPPGRRTSRTSIDESMSSSGPAQVGQAGPRGTRSPAVAASGVTGPAALTALAAGLGARTTEKSCKNCRVRKVKCDRQWPRCQRCKNRNELCDFGTFVPVDAIPVSALQIASSSPGESARVAELEARIALLQTQLAAMEHPSAQSSSFAMLSGSPPTAVPTPPLPPAGAFPPALSPHSDLASFSRPPGLLFTDPNLMPLSEGIWSAFVAGAAGGTGQHLQKYLRSVAFSDPKTLEMGMAIPTGQVGAGRRDVGVGLESSGVFDAGERSPDWQLARTAMARMLVIQLVRSFFNSCCAYLPSFHPWHARQTWLLRTVDNLDPASRVAVAAFCAVGARASAHSALFGIPIPAPYVRGDFSLASTAGTRREQACRAMNTQALDLAHLLGISHNTSRGNLEVLMVMVQLLIFNEFVPKRSRLFIQSAILQFKELQDSVSSPAAKEELVQSIGVPLFTCDAITSAYARKTPLISSSDLAAYFPSFSVPDLRTQRIASLLQDCLRSNVGPDALLAHEGIRSAVAVVHCWVATCQREFAEVAAASLGHAPKYTMLHHLWEAFDQIHEGVRSLQELLVHLTYVPSGCASDACADQHLRLATRFDKDLIDLIFLIHSLVTKTYSSSAHVDPLEAYRESCRRVRKALKLVAFYSELYITSRDPHMSYHLFWQLELLPNWTDLVCQKHGEDGGPESPEFEASETELDWFEKGLICASYYHPLAIPRLAQLRQHRRPSFASRPPATGFHAPPHPVVPPSSFRPAPPYLPPELSHSHF